MSKKISLVDRILRAAREEDNRIKNYSYDALQRRYRALQILASETSARESIVRTKLAGTFPIVEGKHD